MSATSDELEAHNAQIDTLFEQAFRMPAEERVKARDMFLQIAALAQSTIKEHDVQDEAVLRNLRKQAANGYYYAAENEHWLAMEADDPTQLNTQKIEHLERALALHSQVFANGIDGMLVAEYYFGTSLLVEHGLETGDPRTADWAKANVNAARLRIVESGMLNIDPPVGATVELIEALLDHAKVTGDPSPAEEVMQLYATIPEDRRGYSLKKRLRDEGVLSE
ncbi:hypothetical protein [Pontixanthobacter aquaemixtae]|uniref:Uncharacterized protein n=1 Tax=Pontixanthobacter aquaemixtae TaxID=1958940 RepID=A0A844ZV16_9SPHN|nr:hypothetical protein [Pontixanthobacter aquaemixtae]MXO90617.1 hypothetical protein [Pontixanthobacter aquaemixtae]